MRFLRAAVTALPRLRGARVGRGSYVAPGAVLLEHRRITLGQRSSIGRHVELHPQNGFISIGDDCSVNNFVVMYAAGGITIHDECRIAVGVTLIAFNHGIADLGRPIRGQPITARGIVVERGAWIGARAIVLDGVTVGRGSVVGAGAVVTRNVPEYCVVGGNPARVLRHRGAPSVAPEATAQYVPER